MAMIVSKRKHEVGITLCSLHLQFLQSLILIDSIHTFYSYVFAHALSIIKSHFFLILLIRLQDIATRILQKSCISK